jgi:hypothetical protein
MGMIFIMADDFQAALWFGRHPVELCFGFGYEQPVVRGRIYLHAKRKERVQQQINLSCI